MQAYQKKFIAMLLQEHVLSFGEFTLKSGRISPYFFNMGKINSGFLLNKLGEYYADAIEHNKVEYDLLFGPAYKGIPLACTTAINLALNYKKNIPYCFNRKEAKDHGEGGNIVGAPLEGRVLIVDDVITAGTAIREVMNIIEKSPAKLSGVVIALDRQERGLNHKSAIQEIAENYKVPVFSIITLEDIINYLKEHTEKHIWIEKMETYKKQYGCSA